MGSEARSERTDTARCHVSTCAPWRRGESLTPPSNHNEDKDLAQHPGRLAFLPAPKRWVAGRHHLGHDRRIDRHRNLQRATGFDLEFGGLIVLNEGAECPSHSRTKSSGT
jgi:hypothetical protein